MSVCFRLSFGLAVLYQIIVLYKLLIEEDAPPGKTVSDTNCHDDDDDDNDDRDNLKPHTLDYQYFGCCDCFREAMIIATSKKKKKETR
jgi:hypothetical protein